jgi:tRNA threonylcarbamoyladenosine biosynthesis protein TsaB
MLILGIETSARRGNVALCRDDQVLALHRFGGGNTHARDIVPSVDEVLQQAGLSKEQVEALAVSQGPGSFTGLRVGVTCAKTMAYILGWQSVGVPSLEVLVQNVDAEKLGVETACPLRDARRSAVYGTLFRWDGERWRDQTGVQLDSPERLAAHLPEGTLVFGSGADAYPEVFGPSASSRLRTGAPELARSRAEHVAFLGARLLDEAEGTPPMELQPRYYRRTAAEDNL